MSLAGQAGYRPEVDGLRAIAVVSVILFHSGFDFFSGGFVGVDVFFVISGFLITGIILSELSEGRFSLPAFYARRARRILPALVFVLLACVVPAWTLMNNVQLMDFFSMVTAVALFFSNFLLAGTTGYFDGPAEERPLLHTWSLAVEEQYYFLFPLVMLLGWKLGRRRLLALLAVAAVASLAASEFGWRHYRGQNFFFTPSRFWELLAGSIAAFVAREKSGSTAITPSPVVREVLAATGLFCTVWPVLLFGRHTPAPSVWCLVPVTGAALVLLYATAGTWTARILSSRGFVWLGLISYSAYLWHQPLLAFAKVRSLEPLPVEVLWALIAATFGFAFLTWKFIEQPFRRMKGVPVSRILFTAVASSAVLALLGLAGNQAAEVRNTVVPISVLKAFQPPPRSRECFDIAHAHDKPEGWNCGINTGAQATPSFVLFGDSHAMHVLTMVETAAQQAHRTGMFAGFSGCAPILGVYSLARADQATQDCRALNERVLAYVKKNGIKDVVLVARWSYYTDYGHGTKFLNALGLHKGEAITLANSRRAFDEGFARTVQAYKAIGAHLHVLEQVPHQANAPDALYERAWEEPGNAGKYLRQMSVTRAQHARLQSYSASVFQKAKSLPSVSILNFDDLFCDSEICLVGTATTSYYRDRSHLSEEGARRMVPSFVKVLQMQP